MLAAVLIALTTTADVGAPIKGLVAPVFTPLTKDGALDLTAVAAQARWLNASGVAWVFTGSPTRIEHVTNPLLSPLCPTGSLSYPLLVGQVEALVNLST
jgi:hypothetical protein